MEIKEISTIQNKYKNIELLDSVKDGEKTIITSTPLLMYDALGTIVTVCDPLKPLKSKEELAIYTLSSLKSYNSKNIAILQRTINELQLEEIANTIYNNLKAKELTDKAIFFAIIDIITEEYCKKIGDINQELRISVLLKTHKLADPRIFDYINEYSQRTFQSDISQLILTQDNPIMKEVYTKMLRGYDLNIITVPNPQFENLRKNDPELYAQLISYLNRKPNNIGLYDDKKENLTAAKQTGILTQLATGIKNDEPEIIRKEAANLVELLVNEQRQHKIRK